VARFKLHCGLTVTCSEVGNKNIPPSVVNNCEMNKLTNKILLLSFVCFTIISCKNSDNKTDEEIQTLIEKNKDSSLFLSFWKNISEKDFEQIMRFENKKGNLNENNFYFKIPSNNYSKQFDNIEFQVTNRKDYINLNYFDEYWIDNKWGNLLPSEDGLERGLYYDKIIKELIKQYDSKYLRITDYPYANSYAWKIEDNFDRVIIMHVIKNVWLKSDANSAFTFGPHKSENGEKIRISKCEIDLNYSLFSDYLKNIEISES